MKKLLANLAGMALLASPLGVFVAEAEESADNLIEEIIVTATKREESIQDVPIAVSAFSGEDLSARGVEDIYGLMEVSPSIAVYSSNSTSNGGTLRIRGVGTTGNNPGLEAAVGTFVDGIYRSRAGMAFNDLSDIDRIEILRGPQGTLFGKNTVAGAVNIITRKPDFRKQLRRIPWARQPRCEGVRLRRQLRAVGGRAGRTDQLRLPPARRLLRSHRVGRDVRRPGPSQPESATAVDAERPGGGTGSLATTPKKTKAAVRPHSGLPVRRAPWLASWAATSPPSKWAKMHAWG